jgi:hypothetical protein
VTRYYVEHANSRAQVLEVYESFSGWYWFITEKTDKDEYFGLVRGFETEWGYVDMIELRGLMGQGVIWKVPEMNWSACPLIKMEEVIER